jgi:hypothetical protein
MWYIAEYFPTTLFSLRPYNATTSGGKSLVVPTPFAFKMALLDVAIRIHGREQGEKWFPALRDLDVATRLPDYLIVNNTFVKILRPHKGGVKDVLGTGLESPMGNTIAYRELVHFGGRIEIAVKLQDESSEIPPLPDLLMQIHYLGKRGGFMQFLNNTAADALPTKFILLNPDPDQGYRIHGLLQMLDDCGPEMTYAHADVFNGKSISLNKPDGRIPLPGVLPYRPIRSSRSFTLYERITDMDTP